MLCECECEGLDVWNGIAAIISALLIISYIFYTFVCVGKMLWVEVVVTNQNSKNRLDIVILLLFTFTVISN